MTRSFRPALLAAVLAGPFAAPLFGQAPAGSAPKAADPPKPAPPAPNADVEKALELFKQQKFADALKLLEKAAKTTPTLPPPRLQMAQWFLAAGSGQNARLYVEQALIEDPGHPEGYLVNADFAFREGRLTDAILNLTKAQQLAGESRWDAEQKKRFERESRNGLARCYLTRGDFATARDNFHWLLNQDPKNGRLRSQLAEVIFRSGKPEEALSELKTASADDHTLDPPELRMGTLWQMKANAETDAVKAEADRKKAEEYLKQAVSMYDKSAKCKRVYAEWLLEDGKTDAAGQYVTAAVKQDEKSRDSQALLALWHMYKKEYAAAEPILRKMYTDSPLDAFAVGNLALAQAESGDEAKKNNAVQLAAALVKQNEKAGLPYAVYGWCQYKAGKLDEADKAYGQAAQAGQVTFDTAYFMARLLADRGKFEEAHQLLKNAVAAPHGPFVYRADAKALLTEVAKKVPDKKDEPKK